MAHPKDRCFEVAGGALNHEPRIEGASVAQNRKARQIRLVAQIYPISQNMVATDEILGNKHDLKSVKKSEDQNLMKGNSTYTHFSQSDYGLVLKFCA